MSRKRAAPRPGLGAPNAPGKAAARVAGRPAGVWLTFARACGWVMRTLGYSAEEAPEWLRELAIEEMIEDDRSRPRVRAVFTRSVQAQHHENRRLAMMRADHPEREDISYCHWARPAEEFRAGPQVMTEHRTIEHTRWYADDIEAALARELPAGRLNSAPGGGVRAKGTPGRPPQDKWVAVLVETGAWLTDEGDPGTDEAVADFMAERFAERGWGEPSRETRRAMAKI